jgi:hypothetical protein
VNQGAGAVLSSSGAVDITLLATQTSIYSLTLSGYAVMANLVQHTGKLGSFHGKFRRISRKQDPCLKKEGIYG